jgi:hypothetical protein
MIGCLRVSMDSGWDIQVKDCQDIAGSQDSGSRIDTIILDFSKAFDLVPHDRLLTKISASGVDSRVVIWIRDFLSGRTQRVKYSLLLIYYTMFDSSL